MGLVYHGSLTYVSVFCHSVLTIVFIEQICNMFVELLLVKIFFTYNNSLKYDLFSKSTF